MSRQQAMNDSAAPSPSSAGHLTRCLAWAEVSGLELDSLGTRADFLTLNQPFFFDRRPCDDGLEEWMKACGWAPWSPAAESAVVAPTNLVAR
jgi:hypothetical protein